MLKQGVPIRLPNRQLYTTLPATVRVLEAPVTDNFAAAPVGSIGSQLWEATHVRKRRLKPTQWVEVEITEGKNRQVRKMVAAVGLPCLRLLRVGIGPLCVLDLGLAPGEVARVEEQALLAGV